MIRITIDDKLKEQLLATNEIAELCDQSGQVVARVAPLSQEINNPWSLFPELTEEEIERRANAPGPRYSTEQVKEFLQNPNSRPW